MDIASLAPTAPADPTAAVPVPALPGEGFADLFDAAMVDPAILVAMGAVPIPPVAVAPSVGAEPPLRTTDAAPLELPTPPPIAALPTTVPLPLLAASDVSLSAPLGSPSIPLGELATSETSKEPAPETEGRQEAQSPAAGFVPAGFVPVIVGAERPIVVTPTKTEEPPPIALVPTVVGTKTAPLPTLQTAPDLGVVPKVTVDAAVSSVATTLLPSAQPTQAPEPPAVQEAVEPTEGGLAETLTDAALTEKPPAGDDGPPDDAPQDNVPQAAPIRSSATERPEAGADRPEVDRHLVVRQVADRIESLVASRPRDGVTIHLEPRDLGTVTLVVKGLASALDVQMYASDERVREGLEASRPELAQALAPRQIEIRELRVSTSPTPSTAADANPDGRPRRQAPPPQHAFSGKPAKAAETVRAPRSGRGVDLLV